MSSITTRIARWMLPIIILSSGIAFAQTSYPYVDPTFPQDRNGSSIQCTILTRSLRIGSSGSDVTQLQQFLIVQGYMITSATGYFGPLTKRAVIAFQSGNGIPVTGYVGPLTRAAIQRISCSITSSPLPTCIQRPACLDATPRCLIAEPAGGWCPTSVACTLEAKQCPDGSYVGRTPPSCSFAACPTGNIVGLGQHCGGFITNPNICAKGLHCQLSSVPDTGGTCVADSPSYPDKRCPISTSLDTKILSVSPSPAHAGAVVTVTGFGNLNDSTALVDGIVVATHLSQSQDPICLNPMITFTMPSSVVSGTHTLKIQTINGTSNSLVFTVTSITTGDTIPPVSCNGVSVPCNDNGTGGGVIPPVGGGSACLVLTRILSIGMQGTDVTQLQQFLISQGYLITSATGYFGSLTQQAVISFQSANGLSAVGVVGPRTRAAIQSQTCGTDQPVLPIGTCTPRPTCLDNPLSGCNPMEPDGGWCPVGQTTYPQACTPAIRLCLYGGRSQSCPNFDYAYYQSLCEETTPAPTTNSSPASNSGTGVPISTCTVMVPRPTTPCSGTVWNDAWKSYVTPIWQFIPTDNSCHGTWKCMIGM